MSQASKTARRLRATVGRRPLSSVDLSRELVATIRRTMRANKVTQHALAQRLGWHIRMVRALLRGVVESLYLYMLAFRALGLELKLTIVPRG